MTKNEKLARGDDDAGVLRCECGYRNFQGSPVAVAMDGTCPECGAELEGNDE